MKERKEVEREKEEKEAEGKGAGVAAFFDLDGTLVALPSLERRFFRMLRYRRAIRPKNYLLWIRETLRLARRGVSAILEGNKMYLQGVAVDRLGKGGLKPAPTFFEAGLERMAWHARRGHTIMAVSGTLEPLAKQTARAIEAELATRGMAVAVRVHATRLEEKEGRWTGRIVGETMFGHEKARTAKRMAAEMQLDLRNCYAYGDSTNDRWLLETVGRPVAVNPSKELARIAREHRWPVLWWKERKNVTPRTGKGAANAKARAWRGVKRMEAEREPPLRKAVIRETTARSPG